MTIVNIKCLITVEVIDCVEVLDRGVIVYPRVLVTIHILEINIYSININRRESFSPATLKKEALIYE